MTFFFYWVVVHNHDLLSTQTLLLFSSIPYRKRYSKRHLVMRIHCQSHHTFLLVFTSGNFWVLTEKTESGPTSRAGDGYTCEQSKDQIIPWGLVSTIITSTWRSSSVGSCSSRETSIACPVHELCSIAWFHNSSFNGELRGREQPLIFNYFNISVRTHGGTLLFFIAN